MQPTNIRAYLGDTVEFSCQHKRKVSWLFERGDLPPNTGLSNLNGSDVHWLKITDVYFDNAGTYTCQGVNYDFTKFESDAVLEIAGMLLKSHNLIKMC